MATAIGKQNTVDFSSMAIQCQQLKDNTGTAVNMTELTALTGTTASAAELNLLDGVTATTAEINAIALSDKFVLVDDFQGTWLITDAASGPGDVWSTTAGAGTGNAAAVTVTNSLNGEITIKSASDDGTHAQNASLITGQNLGWKANSGGLAIEARLKVDAITDVYVGVGFTDTISTTVELPVHMLTTAVDSDADNAFGIFFDTDATTDTISIGGVKATVDTAPVQSAIAMVADTYITLRIESSAAGVITGYINGTAIGTTLADAVTVTTALTPFVAVANRGAAQRIITVDYIKVEQNRIA